MSSVIGAAERTGTERRERLAGARLYLVTEAAAGGRSAAEIAELALAGGVDVVQLRDRSLPDEGLIEAGRELSAVCARHGALMILNDRPDLAAACGADGVHVGQDDLPPAEARRLVGDELLVGVSTHSPGQVDAALRSEADYLGVGPVFATPTKPDAEPVGLGLVRHAADRAGAAGKPFFAIGGIDARNVAEVARAGAERVAVVRAIRDADDPRAAAAALRGGLEQPRRRPTSAERNAAARAALEPLGEGERPGAVTAAAIACVAFAVLNVVLFALREGPPATGLAYTVLALAMAWALWRAVYGAVLLFQAVLVFVIVFFSFFAIRADSAIDWLIVIGMIGGAGTLFYRLVKSMARIQMRERA